MSKQGIAAVLLSVLLGWALPLWAVDLVNVNTASAKELAQHLNGVGETKAAAIVEYREQHGPYRSVDELIAVKGIGSGLLARNRDRITVIDSESTATGSKQ